MTLVPTDSLEATDRFGSATPGRALSIAPPPAAPAPPARRRRWLLLVVIALVAAGLAVGGVFLGRATAPADGAVVLVATHDIAPGDTVRPGDITRTRIAHVPASAVTSPGALADAVARVPIASGQVITTTAIASSASLPLGTYTVVGLAIGPGQGPAAPLVPGDRVAVIEVPDSSATAASGRPAPREHVLVVSAGVTAVSVDHNGTERISVRVPNTIAARVAAAAAAGRTAVVQLPASGG